MMWSLFVFSGCILTRNWLWYRHVKGVTFNQGELDWWFPAPPYWLFLLMSKALVLNLRHLGQGRTVKMYRMTSPWPRSWLWYWLTKTCLSARWSENQSPNQYKTLLLYLVLFLTWLDFGESPFEMFFCAIFFEMSDAMYSRSDIRSAMFFGSMEDERKGNASFGW